MNSTKAAEAPSLKCSGGAESFAELMWGATAVLSISMGWLCSTGHSPVEVLGVSEWPGKCGLKEQ